MSNLFLLKFLYVLEFSLINLIIFESGLVVKKLKFVTQRAGYEYHSVHMITLKVEKWAIYIYITATKMLNLIRVTSIAIRIRYLPV